MNLLNNDNTEQKKNKNISKKIIKLPKKLLGKNRKTSNNFRINARSIFLTYSRVPENWTLMYVKEMLVNRILNERGEDRAKTKVKAYVISEEIHENADNLKKKSNKHYHCLLFFKKKIDIRDKKYLDIEKIHGNYQTVKDIKSAINYIKKDGRYIEEGIFDVMKQNNRLILETQNEIDAKQMLMDKMSVKEKLDLRKEMIIYKDKTTVKEKTLEFPVFAFQKILEPFLEKAGLGCKGRPIGLLMYGEPESGKTTLAYHIGKEINQEVMLVREISEMTQHYNKEQIILFDEMTKERFEKSQDLFSILITEKDATTAPYYGTKKVIWPRKILIATNENVESWNFTQGMKNRILIVNTFQDGTFQYKKHDKNGILKDLNIKEVQKLIDGRN